jgi:hypothetical protein
VFFPVIYQRESVNLRVNFKKKVLASQLGETNVKHNVLYRNFAPVANKNSYDLESHINSANKTHTHRNKKFWGRTDHLLSFDMTPIA